MDGEQNGRALPIRSSDLFGALIGSISGDGIRARSLDPTTVETFSEETSMAAVEADAVDDRAPPAPAPPSAAMRARAERNRRRALALRQARAAPAAPARPADGGGGFLPAAAPAPAPRAAPRPAPLLDPAERPACLDCGRAVASSYLLDEFRHAVCDDCRDRSDAAELLTRTEAKAAYLLRDADLDARDGGLPCVRRRNPHAARGDMRLYLRAQVEELARRVWGGEAALRAELARREAARGAAGARREARRMRALRLEARSSLFRPARAAHAHSFAEETYDAQADLYSRACACGHVETYEKM